MAGYKLTRKADADFNDLYEYSILNFGEKKADEYATGLLLKLDFLAANPYVGSDKGHIKPGVRMSVYESHSLYYRTIEDGILILRILGPGQDPTRQLNEV